jgi:hypothetical protein
LSAGRTPQPFALAKPVTVLVFWSRAARSRIRIGWPRPWSRASFASASSGIGAPPAPSGGLGGFFFAAAGLAAAPATTAPLAAMNVRRSTPPIAAIIS